MKKKAFKEILKYVRVIVFFAVITILVEAVNYVMVQPGYARYIIHTVDNPDDGSDYDCIVVGASHGRASIDPHYFLEMEYAVNPINAKWWKSSRSIKYHFTKGSREQSCAQQCYTNDEK